MTLLYQQLSKLICGCRLAEPIENYVTQSKIVKCYEADNNVHIISMFSRSQCMLSTTSKRQRIVNTKMKNVDTSSEFNLHSLCDHYPILAPQAAAIGLASCTSNLNNFVISWLNT